MTVQRDKSGYIMPTAVAEIMRAKASLAVAEIMKKESSLLASAFVAGSIALGGMACSNPAAPEVGGEPVIIPPDTIQTDTTRTDTTNNGVDFSEYKQYMGKVLLVAQKGDTASRVNDTIGWAKLYTINGFDEDPKKWGSTTFCIELPNGYKVLKALQKYELGEFWTIANDDNTLGYKGYIVMALKDQWIGADDKQSEPEL